MISTVNSTSDNLYWLTQLTMQKKPEDIFTKMDQNQDGSLDSTELKTFAEELSEKTGKTIDEATLLSILDTNRDGIISKDEFRAGRDKMETQFGFETVKRLTQRNSCAFLSKKNLRGYRCWYICMQRKLMRV